MHSTNLDIDEHQLSLFLAEIFYQLSNTLSHAQHSV